MVFNFLFNNSSHQEAMERNRLKHLERLFNQRQQDIRGAYNRGLGEQTNDIFKNRALLNSGLVNTANPFGSTNFNIGPTGQKIGGQELYGASQSSSLTPEAQGLFNNLLSQFNTGNIGGVKLNPDGGYLQRNLARATPRFVNNRQNLERSLIARGITPGSPQYNQILRGLNQQEASERLGFEDKAFAQDADYQKQILNNQGQLLQQLLQLGGAAPAPAARLGDPTTNSTGLSGQNLNAISGGHDNLNEFTNQYHNNLRDINAARQKGYADDAKFIIQGLASLFGF